MGKKGVAIGARPGVQLFGGPSCGTSDMCRIPERGLSDGVPCVDTIIKPKLGLQPEPFGEV
eukprot:718911-Alexandrium_andersonii.AAC.1